MCGVRSAFVFEASSRFFLGIFFCSKRFEANRTIANYKGSLGNTRRKPTWSSSWRSSAVVSVSNLSRPKNSVLSMAESETWPSLFADDGYANHSREIEAF